MNKKILVTKEGLTKLKQELDTLINERRPEIAKKIQDARDFGDISENSMYDTAKSEQAVIENRIKELTDIVKNATIAPTDSAKAGAVTVGSTVKLHIEGEEMHIVIVGALEANPSENKVSHESPIGTALLGKKVGDKIEIEAPVGKLIYTILDIK